MYKSPDVPVMNIDYVASVVGREFPIYRTEVHEGRAAIYINPGYELDRLEEGFDRVRRNLMAEDYIPYLTREGAEFIIVVGPRPKSHPRGLWVNIIMFVITLISTMAAGALIWAEFISPGAFIETSGLESVALAWKDGGYWLNGALFFALPLMLILGIHETGHYLMAKKHGVAASLPFFLPAPPPLFMLGTFGAFISMRDPIPNRKALVEIGAGGPIAGFIVAIPVTIVGLWLTNVYNIIPPQTTGNVMYLGIPPMFFILESLLPVNPHAALHPTAFAGWVGLFVTFLNLLPAGQLDGGHISRAILGERSRYISYAVVGFLFIMAMVFSTGTWILFGLLVLLLGLKHPPSLNEFSTLNMKQKGIAAFAALMFILCFTPQPFIIENVEADIHDIYTDVERGGNVNPVTPLEPGVVSLRIKNTGNVDEEVDVHLHYIEITNGGEGENVTLNATTLGLEEPLPHINPHALWDSLTSPPSNITPTIETKLFNLTYSGLQSRYFIPPKGEKTIGISVTPNNHTDYGETVIINISFRFHDGIRQHYIMFYRSHATLRLQPRISVAPNSIGITNITVDWDKGGALGDATIDIRAPDNLTDIMVKSNLTWDLLPMASDSWVIILNRSALHTANESVGLAVIPPGMGGSPLLLYIYLAIPGGEDGSLGGEISVKDALKWLETHPYSVMYVEYMGEDNAGNA